MDLPPPDTLTRVCRAMARVLAGLLVILLANLSATLLIPLLYPAAAATMAPDIWTISLQSLLLLLLVGPLVGGYFLRQAQHHANEKQALQHQQQCIEQLLQARHIGFARFGPTGDCLEANPTFARLLSLDPATLQHHNYQHTESWQTRALYRLARQAQQQQCQKSDTLTLTTHFGHHLSLACQLIPLQIKNQQYLLISVKDKTQLVDAAEDKTHLLTILDKTVDLVASADKAGRLRYLNEAGRRLCGIGGSARIDHLRITDLHPPQDAQHIFQESLPIARQQGVWQGDVSLLTHRDQQVPVSHVLLAHRDKLGKIAYYSMIMRDMSRRQQTEEALRQSQSSAQQLADALQQQKEELEHFARVASHDLQEPLRKIHIFNELLRDEIPQAAMGESHTLLTRTEVAIDRMQRLVHGLYQFSRVNGSQVHMLNRVNLRPKIVAIFNRLNHQLKAGSAILTIGPLPKVKANPTQVSWLLENLIWNSLEYHEQAICQIQVSGQVQGSFLEVQLNDNGIGFDNQRAETMFDVFTCIHEQPDRYPGAGVGLYICRKIIQQHGGLITANSPASHGSQVCFTLPLDNPTDDDHSTNT